MLKVLVRATERSHVKDRNAVAIIAQLANSYCSSVSTLKYVAPKWDLGPTDFASDSHELTSDLSVSHRAERKSRVPCFTTCA